MAALDPVPAPLTTTTWLVRSAMVLSVRVPRGSARGVGEAWVAGVGLGAGTAAFASLAGAVSEGVAPAGVVDAGRSRLASGARNGPTPSRASAASPMAVRLASAARFATHRTMRGSRLRGARWDPTERLRRGELGAPVTRHAASL